MGKDGFEFSRVASLDEIAEYLVLIAHGLKHGGLRLKVGDRVLRLAPGTDVKIALKERSGKIDLRVAWRQPAAPPVTALRVSVGPGAQ